MQKTLYILRHAEAGRLEDGQDDRQRHLTPRGKDEAARLGDYLAAQNIRPELVLCSAAARCEETLKNLLPSPSGRRWREATDECDSTYSTPNLLKRPHPSMVKNRHPDVDFLTIEPLPEGEGAIEYVDKLYLASANEIPALLKEVPDTIHSLMLIGHNPGLHELCLKLAKDGDAALRDKLLAGFPTCALATLTFDGRWSDIGKIPAALEGFITPKML